MGRDWDFIRFAVALLAATWILGCSGDDGENQGNAESSTTAETWLEPPSPDPPLVAGLGYEPRACGFDLDRDGIVGEPEDCNLCDGTTADPDGDGVDEDLIYIDCDGGTDVPTCGSPAAPCASVGFAWTQVADGPDDGAEDVLCFRGTCREERIQPAFGGLVGWWALDQGLATSADGGDPDPWQRSMDPTRLVGWDTDDDGAYPPVDTDDTAVFDGKDGLSRLFVLGEGNSHVELAHFTARDYGRAPREGSDEFPEDSGFLRVDEQGGELSHVHVHDLQLRSINQDRAAGREVSTIHLGDSSLRLRWLRVENLLVTDNGGAFALGAKAGEPPDNGPYRFSRISRTAHGCDAVDCDRDANSLTFAFSGYVSGVEILDSLWDANVSAWQPKATGGMTGAVFAIAARYTQDWRIHNNTIQDYKVGLIVRGNAAQAYDDRAPRPVDGIVFDGNRFHNTHEPWKFGDFAVEVQGGEGPGGLVGDVRITHNLLTSLSAWDACIAVRPGNDSAPIPGEIVIAHNACIGPIDRWAALVVGNPDAEEPAHVQPRVTLEGNVVARLNSRALNVWTNYAPDAWRADGNVYDLVGHYKWAGRFRESLDDWRSASGGDANARTCTPEFTDAVSNSPWGDHALASNACTDLAGPWRGETVDTGAAAPTATEATGAVDATPGVDGSP